MARRPDTGRAMHVDPDVPLAAAPRLAGVQSHPHLDLGAHRPRLREQITLRVDRRSDCVLRRLEGYEEGIALIVDLAPAVRSERRAQDSVMLGQEVCVSGPSSL